MFNIFQPASHFVAYLYVGDDKFRLTDFTIQFDQPVDHRSQPQSEINGGLMTFTIDYFPGNTIDQWMLKSTERRSGRVSFQSEVHSSPLEIIFSEAYCIRYEKKTGNESTGVQTVFTISPGFISINGIELTNF